MKGTGQKVKGTCKNVNLAKKPRRKNSIHWETNDKTAKTLVQQATSKRKKLPTIRTYNNSVHDKKKTTYKQHQNGMTNGNETIKITDNKKTTINLTNTRSNTHIIYHNRYIKRREKRIYYISSIMRNYGKNTENSPPALLRRKRASPDSQSQKDRFI